MSSVLKNYRKIHTSQGGDPSLPPRVTTLENNEYKVTYYEVIQGTSGTLVVPSQGTINSDEFGLSGNAILSKIDANGKPTYESPTTSLGVAVTTSLDVSTGAWVVSGVYTDPNVAVIYSIRIKAIYYSNLTYNNIIETIDLAVTKTSQLINDGDDGVSHFISLEDLPSNLTLYATNAASDIPTYYKLVTAITDPSYNTTPVNIPTGAITTTGQLIAILATSANVIVGNPGIFNITTIGNIQKLSGTGNAEFYFEVWQRTLAGVETLITTSGSTLPVLNSGYAEFTASALWNNGSFLSTDRIVLKYYANRIVTGSDPTYQFQFGGLSPVRSLVPIPLNVVPVLNIDELQDVTISSVANNEILTYESSTSLWKNKSVTTALGFTPYNATNPSGYITSSALTGLVPYTGATANVDLGTFTLTTPIINGVSGLLSFKTTDVLNIGNAAVNVGTLGIVRIGQGTSWLDFGQKSAGLASVWANQPTPNVNNFCFGGTLNDAYFNAPGGGSGNIYLQNANSIITTFSRWNFIFSPLQNNYGGNKTAFTFTNPDNLNQTNGIATPSLLYNGGSRNWLTGAIATQSEIVWGATTYSFVAASTITNAYGNVFNAPIAGTNATITNNWAAQFNGNVVIGSTGQLIEIKQTATAPTLIQTGSASSEFRLNSGTRSLKFTSYAADSNYFTSTGAPFRIFTTDLQPIQFYTNNVQRMAILSTGGVLIKDANDLSFESTTGSKIGTATTQKLSFWNATPIVQPTTSVAASTFVSNTSLIANDTATFDGYTIGQIVKALRNVGLLA